MLATQHMFQTSHLPSCIFQRIMAFRMLNKKSHVPQAQNRYGFVLFKNLLHKSSAPRMHVWQVLAGTVDFRLFMLDKPFSPNQSLQVTALFPIQQSETTNDSTIWFVDSTHGHVHWNDWLIRSTHHFYLKTAPCRLMPPAIPVYLPASWRLVHGEGISVRST